MDWIEASVTTLSAQADTLSALMMDAGAKGTQILDRSDVPTKDEGTGFGELYGEDILEGMPEQVTVKAWFFSQEEAINAKNAVETLKARFDAQMGELAFTTNLVQEEDWAENWKQYYKPLRVGQRLVIRPVWEAYEALPQDLVIVMDPGMAFGTGTHETTRLCMEMIEKHFKGGRALDIGTGSGILAISLARLGSEEVVAVDIDPIAVKAAGENIRRNSLESQVQVTQGDLTNNLQGPFDFICANILADVIISLKTAVQGLLKPGAPFLASGIIKDREQDVLEAFKQQGFLLLDKAGQGEWVALVFGLPHA